jgi:serine/threonine-protein kinase
VLFENVRYGTEDNRIPLTASRDRLGYVSWSQRRRLVWVDRKGSELATLGPVGGYEDVRISPDGRRVAVSQRDRANGQNLDVWVLDAERGTTTRITSERTDEFNPTWFPDGERLAYVSDHQGFYDLYERPAAGGAEKLLVRSKQDKTLPSLSADGRQLLFSMAEGARTLRNLVSLDGPREPARLGAGDRFSEENSEISPDGRFTAFESDESGEREIYIEPLPTGAKRQVSVKGGESPTWRRDGAELFYRSRDNVLMSVAVRAQGGRIEASEPRPLFAMQLDEPGTHNARHVFDVSPDGARFLLIRGAEGAGPDDLVIALNWVAVLRRAP